MQRQLFYCCCLCLIGLGSFSYKALSLSDINLSIKQLDSLANPFIKIEDIDLSISFQSIEKIHLTLISKNISTRYLDKIDSITINCIVDVIENKKLECAKGTLKIIQTDSTQKSNLEFRYHINDGLEQFSITNLQFFSGTQDIIANKKSKQWNISLATEKIQIEKIFKSLNKNHEILNHFPIEKGVLTLNSHLNILNGTINSLTASGKIEHLFMDAEQVLEDVALETKFSLKKVDEYWQFDNQSTLLTGAMYLVPGFEVFDNQPGFYLDLSKDKIHVELKGRSDLKPEQLTIDQFSFEHENLLSAKGKGVFNFATDYPSESIDVYIKTNDLSKVYPVYIEPILLATNYSDLKTTGSMSLDIRHEKENLEYLNLKLNELSIADMRDRFSIENLNSDIQMQDSKSVNTSNITWNALSIYKLPFGPANMTFESLSNNYNLTNWQSVKLLDGGLDISTLKLEDIGGPDFKLALGGKLNPISLPQFTEIMSWPTMSGTLEGEFNGFEYTNNNLQILGDIDFKAFDGDIILSDLKIENLFSTNSRLTSSIEISNLDIEILTNTFTFGQMQGTLNGYMKNFTLENWQPVYFDAKFETPKNDHRPHRISQKALENLSEIGGGIANSLSNTLLKFIPEYSYGRFGISCRLEKGICNLGGVKETENGFYILTQGGLLPPWVDVMGTGRSILWDNLIDGIQQISEGEVRFE